MSDIVLFVPEGGDAHLHVASSLGKRIRRSRTLQDATSHKGEKVLILVEEHSIDEGSVKTIAQKGMACFLIDLGQLIHSSGVRRAILISRLRTFISICMRHGALFTFASMAKGPQELRDQDELVHMAMLLGLNRGQAKRSLALLDGYLL